MNEVSAQQVKDRLVAKALRENGYEYTARYVEMFGADKMNPSFTRGANRQTETFYKKCVEEGHPYDWYFEFPEEAVF